MNAALVTSMIVLLFSSVPVAVAIGVASIVGILVFGHLPLLIVPQRMFAGLDSFPLMAVPLFILAGNIMSRGGISVRLVDLAKSLVGGLRGGLGAACVITCLMFAAVSGSSVATTFAIGAILIPAMVKNGYPTSMATSIQATSAELGVLIPPSIPLILYGVATETSVGQLFLGGFGPGLLITLTLLLTVYIVCRVRRVGLDDGLDRIPFGRALWSAIPALAVPVIILGGIYTGIFTPTEASAVAVAAALIVGRFIYGDLSLADLPVIFRTTAISTTSIMLIISAASLFSFLIARSGLTSDIAGLFYGAFDSEVTFLLAINILLLIVGMFVETSAAILVLAPILTPIAVSFGVSPVHFGLIVVVNLALGMVTPPLGVNLFAACAVANTSIDKIIPQLLWFVVAIFASLMVITYVPAITLAPVDWLMGSR
ncbi:TRAP transporter large permease [Marinobacter sp. NFXS9]|uniref:TRAP transporter large permease n=1 Tax=Marinobacter sp. NFXS9 TaxID=2818433 RepID=UPI0032DEEED8